MTTDNWLNIGLIFAIVEDWYISENGTDSRDCGKNYESACATFARLWQRIVKRHVSWVNYIKTDTDLFITDMHFKSPSRRFIFYNLASQIVDITIVSTINVDI